MMVHLLRLDVVYSVQQSCSHGSRCCVIVYLRLFVGDAVWGAVQVSIQ